ncbi:tyrosine-type recombinase/integrase [Nonomuraea sp. MTCD27]|uniref:tyrosine-type recombinase/integrase n=1 Tax=Nonomuraea sp. MTCD27 TaxID=1676747 RepID=UPI0035C1CFE3
MGKRQRDCVTCGAPVGYLNREHCCLCWRRLKEQEAKASCPGCGKQRILESETGKCVLCSRVCLQCGHPVRKADETACRDCRRKTRQEAAKQDCPRCGRPGLLRETTGWCGPCSRPRPSKQPPRICRACGQLRKHGGLGLCSACVQKHPDRAFIRGAGIAARLGDPPVWFEGFVTYLAARHGPARACTMLTELGRILEDPNPNHPQAVLDRSRRPGRSMGSLARALEGFFTSQGLALPTDQAERLAAGRRHRRVTAVPEPLRSAAAAFCDHLLRSRERALRADTRPRTDVTIEAALATIRDLGQFLAAERGKLDWAVVDVHDVEAFLAILPKARKRRLTVLRQFFAFARRRRIVLVNPTTGLTAKQPSGFIGQTLGLDQQRALFRRWTSSDDAHPHEALLGILGLIHGLSSLEVRNLKIDDVDHAYRAIHVAGRPRPIPLDPASSDVVQRCLGHRRTQATANPHLMVTRGTKAGTRSASGAYVSHVLDPCGVPPRILRSTRLVDLVNTLDPKVVAAAFGMTAESVMIYLADQVDAGRLPPGNTR